MKKLLLALIAFFAFSGFAMAAVNLNTATKEELDGVKGIGPAKAQAIVDYRKKNGPFKSVDDLKNVKGFGDKTVDKMRSELTVDGSAPAKAEKKADKKEAKKETKKDEKKDDSKSKKEAKQEAKKDKKEDKKEAKKEVKKEDSPAKK